MKVLLVFLAVFGLSYAAPSKRDLSSDLQQIVSQIPIEEIRAVARRYIESDPEVQQALAYLQGPEWRNLIDTISEKQSWQNFLAFMLDNGVDVQAILDNIRDIIQNARIEPNPKVPRSMRAMIDEIRELVDLNAILLTMNDLLNNSESFQAFFAVIASEESRQFVEEVRAMPEVQRVADVLRDMAVDVDGVVTFLYELLGWQ